MAACDVHAAPSARTRQLARIGSNLNQIARWANTHKSAAEAVEILRGNPLQVAAVADSLQFEHKYTSGVLAWAPDDNSGQVKN